MSRNADTRKDVAHWLEGAIKDWEEQNKHASGDDQGKIRRSLSIATRICQTILVPGRGSRHLPRPVIEKRDADHYIESIRQFAEVCGLIDDATTIEAFVMIFAGQMSERMNR